MNIALAIAFFLLSSSGYACQIARILEPECDVHPDACVSRDLLRDYQRADVVYEVTVRSVGSNWLDLGQTSLSHVLVEHIWKTDGKPIDVLEAGWGRGDCTIALTAGSRYVVFGHRKRSIWSGLPGIDDSLYASSNGTLTGDAFRNESTAHAKLYGARSPGELKAVLAQLESAAQQVAGAQP